jgi:hypothetical protein
MLSRCRPVPASDRSPTTDTSRSPTSVLPDRFIGAWRRRSIALGDAPPAEAHRVLWVQAARCYGDLRVPLPGEPGPAVSFGGETAWDEPRLSWRHELDLDPAPAGATDTGEVSWEGDELVARGVIRGEDREVPYTEEWERLPGSIAPRLALRSVDGRGLIVRVDRHAVAIQDLRDDGARYRATYWALNGDEWTAELAVGEPFGLPPDAEAAGWRAGDVVDHDGMRWTVDEAVGLHER